MSEEPVKWWEVEDFGGWPAGWYPPFEPSLSRPAYDKWPHNLDFRLRPHP